MRNLIQHLEVPRLGNWREQLSLTPDTLAQRSPQLYLSLLALFTVLGQVLSLGFPLTALLLLIGLPDTVGAVRTATDWAGVLLQLAIMAGAAAMSAFLWRLKMPLPAGRPLEAEERAPLDELIASLQTDTRLSRPDAVRITERHQLATACVPRNGYALLSRRVLLLGLPTLQALTTKQAEAAIRRVLCSPNTPKGWAVHAIACHHQCWQQYHATYRTQRTIAARIMAALFSVYWPLYQRFSAPALRWNELERDTLLVQQICVDQVLELLAVDTIVRRYLDEMFWPAMGDTAKQDAQPPHPHASFPGMLHEQLNQEVIDKWLAEAAHESRPGHPTTPAMSARIANLGSQRLEPVSLGSDNAAETLLRDSLGSVVAQMDQIWRLSIRHHWQREFVRHAKGRARLAALRERALTQPIQGRDAMIFTKLAKRYLAGEDAVAVYQQIAAMNPDDAQVLLRVGRLLLRNGSDDGLPLVKRAAHLDASTPARPRETRAPLPVSTGGDSDVALAASQIA